MADAKLRVNILGDASDLSRSLAIASKRLESFGKRAKEVGKDLSLRLTLPIGAAAGAAIKMASDMEESTNKVRVAFGQSSKEVEAFAKTSLRSFGIAESSALDMSALFGDMATGMGVSRGEAAELSTALVGLAGDLASFKNINIEEVTTALSGVFTGETESLKRLGIVMTETNLAQFALDQGIQKNIKSMSQQEKIMLRLQYIFSVTKNAQGDFARTSEGAANQMRIFQESLKEVGAELGSIMLPVFTKAITKVNDLLKEFRALDTGTKTLVVEIGLLAAAIGPLIFVIGQLVESVGSISTAIRKLPAVLGPVTAAITAGALAFDQLSKAIAPNLNFFERFGTALKFIGTPNMIAPMLALADGVKQVTKENEAAAKALEQTNQAASQTPGATAAPALAPATPVAGDVLSDLDSEVLAAEKMSGAIDNLLAQDAQLRYALAAQAAGVVHMDNVFGQAAETFTNFSQDLNESTQQMTLNFESMAQSIGNALSSVVLNGGNVFDALGKIILGTIGDLLIQMGSAAILASNLAKTFAIPGVGAAAGIAAIALGAMIKGLSAKVQNGGFTAFANGGIVSGPTMGLMGEYMGARSNPEVIAPLDRLQSMIGGRNQNVNVTGQFRIDGQDLVVAVERANNERSNLIG